MDFRQLSYTRTHWASFARGDTAIPPPGLPGTRAGKLGPRQIALALCLQSAAFTSLLPKARPYPKSLEPPLKSCLKEKGGETRCYSPAGTAGIPVLPQELEPSPRDLFPDRAAIPSRPLLRPPGQDQSGLGPYHLDPFDPLPTACQPA